MNSIERLVDRLMHSGAQEKSASVEQRAPVEHQAPYPAPGAEQSKTPRSDLEIIDLEKLEAAGMITPGNTRGLISEEYRTIKRPLLKNAFSSHIVTSGPPNLIMVTSSLPGEGKSFTSINLAMSIAMEMDHTVLLVEGDVAKPAIAGYLGLQTNERGLVDYLADEQLSLESLLVRTNVPKLTIMKAGGPHPRSTELLASQNMKRLTLELAQRYPDRVVIFDSPPLLVSSESVVLSGLVGQIVMVVESGKTPQRVVKDALSLIGSDKIVGIVLNKSIGSSSQGYGYGYYGAYGYGRD